MTIQVRTPLPAYAVGTVSGNAGQPVVTGVGTSWMVPSDNLGNTVNVVMGGDILVVGSQAAPIRSVDSATQITLEVQLASSLNAGTAYRIIKYQANQTGGVIAALQALMAAGTDGAPQQAVTVDSGAGRIKARIGANGNPQLAVGPAATADAALAVALEFGQDGSLTLPKVANAPITGFPNILSIAQEIAARGYVPIDRIWRPGDPESFTTRLQKALANYMPGLGVPIRLNPGVTYNLEQRLDFPTGTGLEGGSGSILAASAVAFNNTSSAAANRYGTNAILLAAVAGATGVSFRRFKILMTSVKETAVGAFYAPRSDDFTLESIDASGFNNCAMASIQSCKNFRANNLNFHDGVLHTATTNATAGQLTGIQVDGDEFVDTGGNRIWSKGVIEFFRCARLVCTDEVYGNIGGQTDGITISNIYSDVTILDPQIESTYEPIDCFGCVRIIGGFSANSGHFGLKLVHSARGARVFGFTAFGAAQAGLILQQGSSEANGPMTDIAIQMVVAGTGQCVMGATTASGVTVPAKTLFGGEKNPAQIGTAVNSASVYDVLILDASAANGISNCDLDITIKNSTLPTPVRMGALFGSNNMLRIKNPDGTILGKPFDTTSNSGTGTNNQVIVADQPTRVRAFLSTTKTGVVGTSNYTILFDAIAFDNMSEYSPSTGLVTIKRPGNVIVRGVTRSPNVVNGGGITMQVLLNGSAKAIKTFYAPANGYECDCDYAVEIAVKPGDTIGIAVATSSGTADLTGHAAGFYTWLSVRG